jgi:hypothetical protein
MNPIQNLYKVRLDGKVIREGMTPEAIDALGEISTVVEVHWVDGRSQKAVVLKEPLGIFTIVVPGREYVVAELMVKGINNRIGDAVVYKADGTVHTRLPMKRIIQWNGRDEDGVYNSIRQPKNKLDGFIGVVYDVNLPAGMSFQANLDTNLDTGEVVSISEVR